MDGQFDDSPEDQMPTVVAKSLGAGVSVLPSPPPAKAKSAPAPVSLIPKGKKPAEIKVAIEDEDIGEEDEAEYDNLEAEILKEWGGEHGGASARVLENVTGKMNLSQKASNEMATAESMNGKRSNYQGRDDRATSEQVMDPRTRLMLFKLLNSGFMSEIDGCLSTGLTPNRVTRPHNK